MNIEIRGIDELQRKLGQVASTEVLRRGMQKVVYRVQGRMADYPPPPASSTYRRTGTLGRKWTTDVAVTGDGVQGKVGNNTGYGPWVQSDMFQARVHKGRWQTDRQVLREEEDNLVSIMQDEIDRALR
jgi:hypothetical protein